MHAKLAAASKRKKGLRMGGDQTRVAITTSVTAGRDRQTVEVAMCDECEFKHHCVHAARIAREILRSGDFRGMSARFAERTKDCSLFVHRERRRYA